MGVFFYILTNNIIPIFTLIILGFTLSKKFELDIMTLTKLNFYVFIPAFTFVNLYTAEIPLEMLKVLFAASIILAINLTMSYVIAKIKGYDRGLKNAFANSVLFYNSGNIGIPIITLVFSSPPFVIDGQTPYLTIALTAQIMVIVVQNIATNTLGFINAGNANTPLKQSLLGTLKMPAVYCIPLALVLKALPYDFAQTPFWPALEYARGGLVPVALITLGIQISKTDIKFNNTDCYTAVAMRLIGGPLIAFLMTILFKMDGVIAQVMMISTAVPSSVNSVLIAVECDNHPEFASQAVLISTMLSAVTLVAVIYMASIIFPI